MHVLNVMYYFMKVSNHTRISKLLLTKGYALVKDKITEKIQTIQLISKWNTK